MSGWKKLARKKNNLLIENMPHIYNSIAILIFFPSWVYIQFTGCQTLNNVFHSLSCPYACCVAVKTQKYPACTTYPTEENILFEFTLLWKSIQEHLNAVHTHSAVCYRSVIVVAVDISLFPVLNAGLLGCTHSMTKTSRWGYHHWQTFSLILLILKDNYINSVVRAMSQSVRLML